VTTTNKGSRFTICKMHSSARPGRGTSSAGQGQRLIIAFTFSTHRFAPHNQRSLKKAPKSRGGNRVTHAMEASVRPY